MKIESNYSIYHGMSVYRSFKHLNWRMDGIRIPKCGYQISNIILEMSYLIKHFNHKLKQSKG